MDLNPERLGQDTLKQYYVIRSVGSSNGREVNVVSPLLQTHIWWCIPLTTQALWACKVALKGQDSSCGQFGFTTVTMDYSGIPVSWRKKYGQCIQKLITYWLDK